MVRDGESITGQVIILLGQDTKKELKNEKAGHAELVKEKILMFKCRVNGAVPPCCERDHVWIYILHFGSQNAISMWLMFAFLA